MAIRDTILTLKNKEGTLTGNKVCNFAYDDTAFNDDTTTGANGVAVYNYNNHNNIPVKDNTIINNIYRDAGHGLPDTDSKGGKAFENRYIGIFRPA